RAGAVGPVRRVQGWCEKRPDRRKLAKPPADVPADLDYDLWLGPAAYRPDEPAFVPYHRRRVLGLGGGLLAGLACPHLGPPPTGPPPGARRSASAPPARRSTAITTTTSPTCSRPTSITPPGASSRRST